MNVQVAAVDLGASGGRVVLGEIGPGVLRTETVARFANEPVRLPDGLHWNVLDLYQQAVGGLHTAARLAQARLASVAIDSWAVDYGLIRDGRLLGTPFHYRDEQRAGGVDKVHARISHADLYRRTGLQFLPFNTVYQLAADPWATDADRLLLVPDLLGYWLTGRAVNERTNASTTGLLDVHTGTWDEELITRLGLPTRVFGPLADPGDTVGPVLPEVGERIGQPGLALAAAGSHDTASAVVGVPIQSERAAYISCGTWGLVGVELDRPVLTEASREANFTNETGVDGRIRFLTNVMGLWLLNETVRTWQAQPDDVDGLLAAAASLPSTRRTFDVQDPQFLPPGDMPARIRTWYAGAGLAAPDSRPALVRAIVDSLARAFAEAVDRVAELSGRTIEVIHLVGGGVHNRLLCQVTADRSGREVIAGPVEATAIGNLLVQARAAGALPGGLEDLRRLIADTTPLQRFSPRTAAPGTRRAAP